MLLLPPPPWPCAECRPDVSHEAAERLGRNRLVMDVRETGDMPLSRRWPTAGRALAGPAVTAIAVTGPSCAAVVEPPGACIVPCAVPGATKPEL